MATLVNSAVTNGRQVWTLDAYSGHQLIRLTDSTGATTLGWTVIADDGNVESYDANGRLLSIQTSQSRTQSLIYSDGTAGPNGGYAVDASGNLTTTVLPTGLLIRVTEDFGRTISFGYDAFSHLMKAADAIGQTYLYGYDANGHLTSVTYPDGKVKQYLNNETPDVAVSMPQAITGIIDENGTRYATYTYDAQGRATSSTHWKDAQATQPVDQTQVAFSADVNGNPLSSVVTDPLGTQRTYGLTSVLNLIKSTGSNQPAGAGCAAAGSAQTFDANGNLTSLTDFDGNLSCFASDQTRNLETIRLEGLTSGASCPANLSTYSPTAGTPQRLIQTQWHPTFRVKTAEATPLKRANWIYNGQSDPSNGNAIASCAPTTITIVQSSAGALLHFDGANGSTTFADALGHAFTGHGSAQISTAQSKFGASALSVTASTGDYISTGDSADFAFGSGDFTIEGWVYITSLTGNYMGITDKRPNTSVTSPNSFVVAPSGVLAFGGASGGSWVISLTGATVVTTGVWHHVAVVRHGNIFTLYLDGGADASGTFGAYALDANSSAMSIGAGSAGGGYNWNGYLDEVRITKGTAVYTANFTPPSAPLNPITTTTQVPNVLANGVPPAVLCKKVEQATTDANGAQGFSATATGSPRVWTYTYNAYGQQLTATGPRGNLATNDPNYAPSTTTTQYYASTDMANSPPHYQMGDRQSMTDALGHTTQFTRYDGNGRLLEQVDANGVTTDYAYYPRGWLQTVTVTPAGGGAALVTSYTYDGIGQLQKTTLPDATYVKYTYDAAHRLTQITDSAGDTVNYTLDAIGNPQAEKWDDPGGVLRRNISRAYDALNRLQTVTGATQ